MPHRARARHHPIPIHPSIHPLVNCTASASACMPTSINPPRATIPAMSPTSPRLPSAGVARQQTSPAPSKVPRDSHLIRNRKASSSSSSTNSSVSSSSGATNIGAAPRQKQHAQQQPVIIYTHSPKVIRTNPRDFMSIVQKLTGLESTGDAAARGRATANAGSVVSAQDESSSSSESCAHAHAHPSPPPPYMDPQLMPPLDAHFMPDIPLFAPGASELLSASRGLYGQFPPVDAAALGPVMSTNMRNAAAAGRGGAVFSPSMVEAMRTFPDY